jgi:lipoprotein-anchoring transpeptidase ErfK/SrfK
VGGAYAWDSAHEDVVASGITVSGVAVGGLDKAAAERKLEAELGPRLTHNVVVEAGGQRFYLSPARAGVKYDFKSAVDAATEAGRSGWLGQRVWNSIADTSSRKDIPVTVSVSKPAVDGFARRVAGKANRPVIEAHLEYGGDWIKPVAGTPGEKVKTAALADAVASAFQRPGGSEQVIVHAPQVEVKPSTSVHNLGSKYQTVITVSRSGFKLYLWKNLKLEKTFNVAVGMAGLETPAGLYSVQDKQTNPSWHVPNSAWAGSLAGKTIPPGPDNPIKARWMGLAGGVGIHGTGAVGSLGSAASHGCIRMDPTDVIWLYDRVPMGTPVYIS